jgi:pilus assembly protein CpaB
MKSSKALIVLFLALISGVAAMMLATKFISGGGQGSAGKVVVALQDIPLGTPISAPMLQEVTWPGDNKPTGAFNLANDLVGRVPSSNILRGEPILDTRLAAVGSRGGLAAAIPQGYRAITVKVNEVVGVAGFALPGSFVDVMVNVRADREESVSKIVLERIQVLAVAQEAFRDETKPKVVNAVTLQVLPDQAEKIDLARSIGTLSLVLRNQIDEQISDTKGIRSEDLLPTKPEDKTPPPVVVQAPKVAAKAAPSKKPVNKPAPVVAAEPASVVSISGPRVEVIRGIRRSESEL